MNNDLQKFDELQTQISVLVAPVKDVVVSDHETSTQATKAFRELNDWEKKVEAKRKELVGPLNDQVDRINEFAKQIKAPLLKAKSHISDELKKFERVLEAQRQEALRFEREERMKREVAVQAEIAKQRAEAEARANALKDEAETIAMFAGESAANEVAASAEAEAARIKAEVEAEAARLAFEARQNHWDAKKEINQNKVSGTRRTWTYRVLDFEKVPVQFKVISLDEKKIKALIGAGMREIEGLEIYQELSITAR